jgi:hypothetical protein
MMVRHDAWASSALSCVVCVYGILCVDMWEPDRPFFQGNLITECSFGAEIENSGPRFDANKISHCRHWAMSYARHCGGGCTRNVITYSEEGGVWVYMGRM